MRIATWNINSIRARADRALGVLERWDLDVLLLQETKCKPEQFPVELFEAAGYEVAAHGLSQWNGVAIVSRVGIENVRTEFPGQPGFEKKNDDDAARAVRSLAIDSAGKEIVEGGAEYGDAAGFDIAPPLEARAIGATCAGVDVWSLYVPNGRALGDPHLDYKIDFLHKLSAAAGSWLQADSAARILLGGDWNVVPLDTDVWDIAAFADDIYVTEPERAAFNSMATAGFREVTREADGATYTFWDYQKLRFPKNEGMRIDFAWASPVLADQVTSAHIDRNERKGKGASDHVPVVVDIAD